MVLSEENDDELFKVHQEICSKLNLDPHVVSVSWETFESISKKFVLEGEKTHWLGCSIYVACSGMETPTLDTSSIMKGSGVNLTSLLRYSNLSFVQFFSNIARWADMAQLPDDFRRKIDHLRNTFSVAYNTFKKYLPAFVEIFVSPIPNLQDIEASKHRNRKMRPIPFTVFKIFEFVWNMFIVLKAEEPSCSTELIKCHHLLYCCIDLAFQSLFSMDRRDLFNSTLCQELLLANCTTAAMEELPCIVKRFCKCETVIKEALHMKVYIFRDLVAKLIKDGIIMVNENNFTNIFKEENFDHNYRYMVKAYETHLLSNGDFDERIFLGEYKRQLMEKEQNISNWTSIKVFPAGDSVDTSAVESPRNGNGTVTPKGPDTPLTGRRFLSPRETNLSSDKSISERISRLHSLIGNRSPEPNDSLKELFGMCRNNPTDKIQQILSNMKEKVIAGFTINNYPRDEAENYLQIGTTLFYKYIESVLQKERIISPDISALVKKDLFYQCMFTCCLEIVLFSYNFPKAFPWILEVIEIEPIHFVKVIELIVRSKDHISRELIKHLNRVEETVIESLAWKSNSPIWEVIANSGLGIPKFEDTALPGHLLYNDNSIPENAMSPIPGLHSPGPSASDVFQSPSSVSQVSRNLFPSNIQAGQSVLQRHTHLMIPGKDGNIKLIPIVDSERQKENHPVKSDTTPAVPKKSGSLTIIFRKFYNLAGVRMQHLCTNLGFTDFELKRKIWTIFEDSIRHTDLIKDRHLDQLLMCAIYVICKACNISNHQNLFTVIMKFYRQQPQASSSVYRDVLIEKAKEQDGQMISEKRNDLIQFYNSVYVKAMQTYAIRFQPNANQNGNVILSPLPATRRNLVSPNMHVVGNVFVKPLEASNSEIGSSFNYFFSRSPSKDLKNINRAINNNGVQGKRLLVEDGSDVIPNAKRISNRKIQSLVEERRSQNLD